MKLRSLLSICALVTLIVSCRNQGPNKSHGPIVMGDSSTIITETNPDNLRDGVADLRMPSGDDEDSSQQNRHDTISTITPASQAPAFGNGLTAAFKEVTVTIPNINTRAPGKNDLTNARGASYTLVSGNLAGTALHTSGSNVSKVSQRTQTVVALQDGADKLVLDNLGATSSWQPLQGNNGNYPLSSLDPSKLEYKNARPADIHNAVQQAARKAHLNRQDTQDWLNAAKNMRAANQSPGMVVLKTVTWRIEGKDARDKSFTKELRIDIP